MRDMNLIRSLAWSFQKTTGISFDDLLSEAVLAYLENLPKWDSNKSQRTTFLYRCMQNHLCDYVKAQQKYKERLLDMDVTDLLGASIHPGMLRYSTINDIVKNLQHTPEYEYFTSDKGKKDVQHIIEVVLNCDEDLSNLKPKMARGSIYRFLRQEGWTWPRIWQAMRDVKMQLNEILVA